MTELSDKQLRIGIWWVTHRDQLKKWWVILLAVGDILLFLYLLFNTVIILLSWTKFTSLPYQIGQPVVDFKSYQQKNAPQALRIISTKYIRVPEENEQYHLLAEVQNPNERWSVPLLDYHFTVDGVDLEQKKSYFLPNEQRFLIQYNAESKNVKPVVKFIIEDVSWHREEKPEKTSSLAFEIKNPQTTLIPLLTNSRSSPALYSTRVTAEVTNKSVYNFWQVKFVVVLYQGREPIAVNEITLEKFLTQETREIGVSWKEAYPSISKVTIIPEVNILDPGTTFETEASEPPSL